MFSNDRDALLNQESRVDDLRLDVPPIEHIPPEILSRIFVAASNVPLLLPFDGSQAPWVIGRVCKKWKAISLLEPLLWNDLVMFTQYDAEEDREEILQGLQEVTPLSNGSLSLNLYYSDHKPDTLSQIILPYLPRVQKLTLQIPNLTSAEFRLFPPESFISIEEFVLSTFQHSFEEQSDIFHHLEIFSYMKNLKKLAIFSGLDHTGIADLIQTRFIPWGQLTSLQISRIPDREGMISTLRLCGFLEHLMYGSTTENHITSPQTTDLILPRLKSFTLDGRAGVDLPLHWERLRNLYVKTNTWESLHTVLQKTPYLETLSIAIDDSLPTGRTGSTCRLQYLKTLKIVKMPGWMAAYLEVPQLSDLQETWSLTAVEVCDLISRSSCALRRLSSSASECPSPDETSWYTLLASQSMLAELHVPHMTLSREMYDGIANGSFLPALRVFHAEVEPESLNLFAHMVEKRVMMGGILREAYGYCYKPVSKDACLCARERLAKLNESIGSSFNFKIPDIYLI